jgi:hypothetical protein
MFQYGGKKQAAAGFEPTNNGWLRGCSWLVLEEVGSIIIRVFVQILAKTASEKKNLDSSGIFL